MQSHLLTPRSWVVYQETERVPGIGYWGTGGVLEEIGEGPERSGTGTHKLWERVQ